LYILVHAPIPTYLAATVMLMKQAVVSYNGSAKSSSLRGATDRLQDTHLNWPVDCWWGRTFGRDLKSEITLDQITGCKNILKQ